MTATTSSILSGLLHSSHPHASISAAFARQAQVGVGLMPNRFSNFDSSVPGPWVGGAGNALIAAEGAGQARIDPQKKSLTPQTVQRFVDGSH
jgi:hypothetical protein